MEKYGNQDTIQKDTNITRLGINLSKVTYEYKDSFMYINGPQGSLKVYIHPTAMICIDDNKICKVYATSPSQQGTCYRLLQNAVVGVTKMHQVRVEVTGGGYTVKYNESDKRLELVLGYSSTVDKNKKKHPRILMVDIPKNITVKVGNSRSDSKHNITSVFIQSCDKQLASDIADKIIRLRKCGAYSYIGVRRFDKFHRIKSSSKKGS